MEEAWLPDDLYVAREDEPDVRPHRPICQGDVFRGVGIVRGVREVQSTVWKTKVGYKPETLAMVVAHPCSSRSNESHRLKPDLTLAPIVPKPPRFEAPWQGFYELFPLPGLVDGGDYVAELSRVFPIDPDGLCGRRIACLTALGLAALLDRLTKNATRLEPAHVPGHFASEAERLTFEFDLWEIWVATRGTEEGFQEWLDRPWLGTSTRRKSMRGHFEEIKAELERELAT